MISNKDLSIYDSTNMTPSGSLEIKVLSNHYKPAAANSHGLPLIHQEDIGPLMYPMRSHSNNLQKVETSLFVKDNIVSTMTHCPTHNRNTHADSSLSCKIGYN
jgi:hypothetical protein